MRFRHWIAWRLISMANRLNSEAVDLIVSTAIKARYEETFKPTHVHRQRRTEYEAWGVGRVQCAQPLQDNDDVVIYRDREGRLWARTHSEFMDGRFRPFVGKSALDDVDEAFAALERERARDIRYGADPKHVNRYRGTPP